MSEQDKQRQGNINAAIDELRHTSDDEKRAGMVRLLDQFLRKERINGVTFARITQELEMGLHVGLDMEDRAKLRASAEEEGLVEERPNPFSRK